ncbi:hypothetical protein ERJ75_001270700 [Trypanosoma vivax]|nr:hypothetical protein ERJ75_001270700 [Trypanosoma vivax]
MSPAKPVRNADGTKTRRPRKRSRAGAGLSKKRSARVWAAKLASMRLLRGRRMDGEGRLGLRPVSGDAVHQPNRGPERSAALAGSGTTPMAAQSDGR